MLDFADSVNSQLVWLQALILSLAQNAPVNAAMAGSVGSVTAEVWGYLSATAGSAFLSTAKGPALVALAADRGVTAGVGTPSTASLTLTLTGLQPVGAQFDSTSTFATSGDALNPPVLFTASSIVTLTPGQTTATVPVTSTTVGTVANVGIGTITVMVNQAPWVQAVTNVGAATGGTDKESDASLLTATQAALAAPGTVTQLQKTATSQPNITAAVVIDAADGAGTVTVYALDAQNTLTGATTTPYVATPLFEQDTMTGAAGTSILSHTGEVGATWTRHASYGSGAAVIDLANRLRNNIASNTSLFYASGVSPASPEYDVWADLWVGSVINDAGVAGRIATGANTLYYARYHSGTTAWQLWKIVGGAATQLGSDVVQVLTPGSTYRLKLQLRNGSQKVLVSTDGGTSYTTKISTSDADAALTAAGRVGAYFSDGGTVATDTTALHISEIDAIGPGSLDSGASEAETISAACLAVASPGLTLKVAQLTTVLQAVTLTSVTQVPGSGLTSGQIVTAMQTYLSSLLPGQAYVPSLLQQYLFNVAFNGLLLDIQPSVMSQTAVSATQVIRAGACVVSSGP